MKNMPEMDWTQIASKARKPSNELYPPSFPQSVNVKFHAAAVEQRKSARGFDQFVAKVEALDDKQQWVGKDLVLNQFQLGDLVAACKGPPAVGKAYLLQVNGTGPDRRLHVRDLSQA